LTGSAGTVATCAEAIVAPLLGSPISLAGIFRLTKSAQFTAALPGDDAAAIRIATALLMSAVSDLMVSPPHCVGIGNVILERGEAAVLGAMLPAAARTAA
jgi:hypothetical protein